MISTLSYLDLSHNKLGLEGITALSQWLSQPNNLKVLKLVNCGVSLNLLGQCLEKGCNDNLCEIDLSDNKLKPKDDITGFCKYLSTSVGLRKLVLESVAFNAQQFKSILDAIQSNENLENLILDFSSNQLESVGANILSSFLKENPKVVDLNVADNEFGDQGLEILFNSEFHDNLVKLNCSDNYKSGKKGTSKALEALSLLFSEDKWGVQELILRADNSRFAIKSDLAPILIELNQNQTLTKLDITGQKMEIEGALALGKLLQLNANLTHLRWDDNDTPIQGLQSFRQGLLRNNTLYDMRMPLNDISNIMKSGVGIEFHNIIQDIQSKLLRNHPTGLSSFIAPSNTSLNTSSSVPSVTSTSFNHMINKDCEELEQYQRKIHSTGKMNAILGDDLQLIEDTKNHGNNISSLQLLQQSFVTQFRSNASSVLTQLKDPFLQLLRSSFVEFKNSSYEDLSQKYESLDLQDIFHHLDINEEDFEKSFNKITEISTSELTLSFGKSLLESTQSIADGTYNFLSSKLDILLQKLDGNYVPSSTKPKQNSKTSATLTTPSTPPLTHITPNQPPSTQPPSTQPPITTNPSPTKNPPPNKNPPTKNPPPIKNPPPVTTPPPNLTYNEEPPSPSKQPLPKKVPQKAPPKVPTKKVPPPVGNLPPPIGELPPQKNILAKKVPRIGGSTPQSSKIGKLQLNINIDLNSLAPPPPSISIPVTEGQQGSEIGSETAASLDTNVQKSKPKVEKKRPPQRRPRNKRPEGPTLRGKQENN